MLADVLKEFAVGTLMMGTPAIISLLFHIGKHYYNKKKGVTK